MEQRFKIKTSALLCEMGKKETTILSRLFKELYIINMEKFLDTGVTRKLLI